MIDHSLTVDSTRLRFHLQYPQYSLRCGYCVAHIDGNFIETFDGNLFLMLVMAVDGQEDIGDQPGQHLDHESILAP